MKQYLYCLIDDDVSTETLIYTGVSEGISGSVVNLYFPLADFGLLVSDFAGASVPVTRENVLKHAAVVNSFLPVTTPLPFRFGTLATDAELESFLTARGEAIRAKQALIRGCVEMSVKIILELKEPPSGQTAGEKPGTAFLSEKRREILGSEELASWLGGQIGDSVRGTRINTIVTDKLLLSVAHLVERESVERYRIKLKAARAARPELKFLTSGPWPPYSFANIDLEFPTQFGVS